MTHIYRFDQQGWYGMFVACGIWCLARRQTYHINLVDQTHIQRTHPRRKTDFFNDTHFSLPLESILSLCKENCTYCTVPNSNLGKFRLKKDCSKTFLFPWTIQNLICNLFWCLLNLHHRCNNVIIKCHHHHDHPHHYCGNH